MAIWIGSRRVARDRNLLTDARGDTLLEPKVMDLLLVLASRPGEVFGRAELIDAVWGVAHGGDESLTRAVSLLRRAFAPEPVVETIAKRGYRLSAPVRRADDTASASRLGLPSATRRPPILRWGAIAAVSLAVGLVASRVWPDAQTDKPERVSLDITHADPTLAPLTAAIRTEFLSALPTGEVVIVGTAGEASGQGLSVNGSASRERGQTRVRLGLSGGDGVSLWSHQFVREQAEEHLLEAEIAAHLADVLRCALSARGSRVLQRRPELLATYLSACDGVRRYQDGAFDLLPSARRLTTSAPQFASGWSMRAMAAAVASRSGPPETAEALAQEARDAARRATALDASNAESWLALATLLPTRAYADRQILIRRALRADAASADAHAHHGFLLLDLGLSGEALAAMRRAASLDPLSPEYRAGLVTALGAAGRRSEQRELARHSVAVWPRSRAAWNNRFKSAAFIGDPDDALEVLRTRPGSVGIEDEAARAWADYLEAKRDRDPARLRQAVADMEALADRALIDRLALMVAAASAGEVDAAFRAAERAYVNPAASPALLFLPSTRSMRADDRFAQLARSLGLVAEWRRQERWPDGCTSGTTCWVEPG